MSRNRVLAAVIIGLSVPALAHAQVAGGGGRGKVVAAPGAGFQITESTPIEVTSVKNAPFAARAETEFTQILVDGNRIDRRYESSVARDSRGRTRREEQIALVGALASPGAAAPRLVTVVDPDAGVSYTIDDEQRVAYRNVAIQKQFAANLELLAKLQAQLQARSGAGDVNTAKEASKIELSKIQERLKAEAAAGGGRGAPADQKKAELAGGLTTADLGTRTIEGVRAQGTRTTQTIAAGAIGNALPIEIVSERWFSPELQMAVLITRHDPMNGDTVYRLTNIQRGEQADGLFSVPPGYEVKDGEMHFVLRSAGGDKKVQVSPRK